MIRQAREEGRGSLYAEGQTRFARISSVVCRLGCFGLREYPVEVFGLREYPKWRSSCRGALRLARISQVNACLQASRGRSSLIAALRNRFHSQVSSILSTREIRCADWKKGRAGRRWPLGGPRDAASVASQRVVNREVFTFEKGRLWATAQLRRRRNASRVINDSRDLRGAWGWIRGAWNSGRCATHEYSRRSPSLLLASIGTSIPEMPSRPVRNRHCK